MLHDRTAHSIEAGSAAGVKPAGEGRVSCRLPRRCEIAIDAGRCWPSGPASARTRVAIARGLAAAAGTPRSASSRPARFPTPLDGRRAVSRSTPTTTRFGILWVQTTLPRRARALGRRRPARGPDDRARRAASVPVRLGRARPDARRRTPSGTPGARSSGSCRSGSARSSGRRASSASRETTARRPRRALSRDARRACASPGTASTASSSARPTTPRRAQRTRQRYAGGRPLHPLPRHARAAQERRGAGRRLRAALGRRPLAARTSCSPAAPAGRPARLHRRIARSAVPRQDPRRRATPRARRRASSTARAEVFVYPSLAEGFGLPSLEAMACGTPGRRLDRRRARRGRRRRGALRARRATPQALARADRARARGSEARAGAARRRAPRAPRSSRWEDAGARRPPRRSPRPRGSRMSPRPPAHRHRRPQARRTSGSAPTSATSLEAIARRPESRGATASASTSAARDRDAAARRCPPHFEIVEEDSPGYSIAELTRLRLAAAARPARPLPRHALRHPAAAPRARRRHDPRHHPRALPAVPAQPRRAALRARDDPPGAARAPTGSSPSRTTASATSWTTSASRRRAIDVIYNGVAARFRPGRAARRARARRRQVRPAAAVPALPRRREAAQERAQRPARVRRGAPRARPAARPRARRARCRKNRSRVEALIAALDLEARVVPPGRRRRRRTCPASSPAPTRSSTRRSTKASACPSSRRWPAACPC